MDKIRLAYVTIEYKEPIVYFTYAQGSELGFPEIRELIACAEKLSGNKPYVTLADARADMNITDEGKRVVSDPQNMPLFRGTAIIVKNSMYSFAVNIMSTLSRRQYPFRAFTNKQKAIEWLESLSLEKKESATV